MDGFQILDVKNEGDGRPLLGGIPEDLTGRPILGGEHEEEVDEHPNLGVGDRSPVSREEEVGRPIPSVAHDEVDCMPNEHFLYSLKDFQPFESHTYRGKLLNLKMFQSSAMLDLMPAGIVGETRQWVTPFISNVKLQTAFLAYTRLPGSYEKLNYLPM